MVLLGLQASYQVSLPQSQLLSLRLDTQSVTWSRSAFPFATNRAATPIYTDVNLLPLGETVRNLPAEENSTHILTNISGKTCRNGSRVVATDQSTETTETSVTVGDRLALSKSDDFESFVDVAEGESVGVGESTPVSKRGEELSPEALTHILINFTDVDRRMLLNPLQYWGTGKIR